jgi:hypothetical protein
MLLTQGDKNLALLASLVFNFLYMLVSAHYLSPLQFIAMYSLF